MTQPGGGNTPQPGKRGGGDAGAAPRFCDLKMLNVSADRARQRREGADLLFVDVPRVCIRAAWPKSLKNSARASEGLQLILNLIFLRKLLPQTLDSYIKARLIDRDCKCCLFRK